MSTTIRRTYPRNSQVLHVPHTYCTTGTYPRLSDRREGSDPPYPGVTMSLHKLTAGSGYDYLTRQVAALDSTEKGHTGLAAY